MAEEIVRELAKCEQALYEMQVKYPQLARAAANARYVYDQAWADAIDDILHKATVAGEKPPTLPVQDALATKAVAQEMKDARETEADLDGAKKHLETLQAILSSVQTRAKIVQIEMGLAK